MSFVQQDPRILQEQDNTNVLQDDAGQPQAPQTAGEAQNATSQPPQSMPTQGTGQATQLPKTPDKAPRSGMFTNIKSYIDKNRAASQKMAESVGQAIQKKQELAKQNLQNVQNRYSSNVEQGSLQGRDTAVGEVRSRALQAGGMDASQYGKEQALRSEFGDRYSQYETSLQDQKTQREQDQNQLALEQQRLGELQDTSGVSQTDVESFRNLLESGGYGKTTGLHGGTYKGGALVGGNIINSDNALVRGLADFGKSGGSYKSTFTANELNNYINQYNQQQMDAYKAKQAPELSRTQSAIDQLTNKQYQSEDELLRSIIGGESSRPKLTNDLPTSNFNVDRTDPSNNNLPSMDKESTKAFIEQKQQDAQGRLSKLDEILGASYDPVEAADDTRFKEIIDAKYGGPKNLFETAGYGDAASKVERAQLLRQMSESPEQYQQLLDQTLSLPGRDYTSGQKQLDELLFGRGDAQQAFKDKTKDLENMGDYFSQQKSQARQMGLGREQEIENIRGQARGAFQGVAGQRDEEVESRLSQTVENWDQLPEHFRDIFRQGAKTGNVNLSALEAQTLGVQGGEQLFDKLKTMPAEEIIKATEAEKDRLISTDEQAQLAELQRLAGLSRDYGVEGSDIDYRSGYQDADRAGTQSALDAIDSGNLQTVLRDALRSGQDYLGRQYSAQGIGQDRYKRFGRKSKTVTAHANADAKLKDVLDKGYVSDVMGRKADDLNVQQDLTGIKDMAKFIQEAQQLQDTQGGPVDMSAAASAREAIDDTGFDLTDAATQIAMGNSTGLLADLTGIDELAYLNPMMPYIKGAELVSSGLKDIGLTDVGNVIGDIAGSVGGYLGGYKKAAKSNAARFAQMDANRKLTDQLQNAAKTQGIGNQVGITRDDTVKARTGALMDLLSGIDKTNL